MKVWVGIVMAACAATALAGQPKKKQTPHESVIWDTIHNRFVSQLDYWFDDGDYPRCIQLLRVMYGLDPDDYESATDLGWMLENIEQYDEALSVYVKFRKENPTDADAPFPEANFYFRQKLFAKVPPLLDPSLTLKPHPNSWRILAHSYEKLGMFGDSKRVWTGYLKLHPDDEPAKLNLKRVEGKIGSDPVRK